MREVVPRKVEYCRVVRGPLASTAIYGFNGAFSIPYKGRLLKAISSDQEGWDHVSVSFPGRCPTWSEMCYVKSLFFNEEELVLQFHPPKSDYINDHPYVLHLWRKHGENYELPPAIMV